MRANASRPSLAGLRRRPIPAAALGLLLAIAPPRLESAVVGKAAPAFELRSLDGKTFRLSDLKGKVVVLEWLNPECPYCAYSHGKSGTLKSYIDQLRGKGIAWISIVSEGPEREGGKPEHVRKFVDEVGIKGTVLVDAEGKVGRSFGAKTTPQVCLISERGVLVYRGAPDNAPLGKVERNEARRNYVAAALADLTSGHAVTQPEVKPYGTPIQYARAKFAEKDRGAAGPESPPAPR